jgi:hypothetical protein
MINFRSGERRENPFPHVYFDQVFSESDFNQIAASYPSEALFAKAPSLKSRADYNIYEADRCYEEVLQCQIFDKLHNYIKSEAFLSGVTHLFRDDWKELGLKLKHNDFKPSAFVELREKMVHGSQLNKLRDRILNSVYPQRAHQLFTRLDFSLSGAGYGKPPHIDNENRVCAGLIYISDGVEDGIEGGELVLFDQQENGPQMPISRTVERETLGDQYVIPIRKNSAVFFPCHPLSYHGVNEILAAREKRKFFYISISSQSFDVWS